MHSKEFAGNQGKHQNFDPSSLPFKFGLIFMRMKQKKSKWPFFKIANSRKNFAKISQIGPWDSRIDLCEGH